jgi:hypothetical protein
MLALGIIALLPLGISAVLLTDPSQLTTSVFDYIVVGGITIVYLLSHFADDDG